MQIFVKLSSGEKHDLQVDAAETVAALKARLATVASLPEEQQRLVYKGRVLQDNKTLCEYGLEEGHVVHAVRSRHEPRFPWQAKQDAAQPQRGPAAAAASCIRRVVARTLQRCPSPRRALLCLGATRQPLRNPWRYSAATPPPSAAPTPAGLGAGLPGFGGGAAADEAGAWQRCTAVGTAVVTCA